MLFLKRCSDQFDETREWLIAGYRKQGKTEQRTANLATCQRRTRDNPSEPNIRSNLPMWPNSPTIWT
jgi:hypothetical protein